MPILRRPALLLLASFLLIAGCATAGADGERVRRDTNVITNAELADAGTSNLYDAINRLRPRWLAARAARTLDMQEGGIFVFQNATTPLGGIEVLRQMDINSAYSLRFMDGSEAQATLPGLRNRHVEGAIIVYVSQQDAER
jgi:hypothetical protein